MRGKNTQIRENVYILDWAGGLSQLEQVKVVPIPLKSIESANTSKIGRTISKSSSRVHLMLKDA